MGEILFGASWGVREQDGQKLVLLIDREPEAGRIRCYDQEVMSIQGNTICCDDDLRWGPNAVTLRTMETCSY